MIIGFVFALCPNSITLNDIEWTADFEVTGETSNIYKILSSSIENSFYILVDDGTTSSSYTMVAKMDYTQNITW